MEQLHATIDEVRERLVQVDAELEAVGQALDPLDSKAATQAVIRKSKLTQEREALLFRLPALEQALREAERSTVAGRLAAIAAALSELAEVGEKETQRFSQAMLALTALVEEAGRRRQTVAELREEAWYLSMLHDLDYPVFSDLPMPEHQTVEQLARLLRDSMTTSTPWSFRLDQLRQQRQEEAPRREPKPELIVIDKRPLDSEIWEQEQQRQEERQRNTLRPYYPEGQDETSRVEVAYGPEHTDKRVIPRRPNTMRRLLRGED